MPTDNDLAVNGGTAVRQSPWPARGLFGQEEKDVVVAMFDQCIETGEVIGYNGPEEAAYCQEFAEFLGGGYADGVNSGSSAVYVALRAADIPPFTEVICGPITDPGGIMPVPMIGCIPVVADAAPGCYNTSPEEIAKVITPQTSAILVAHIGGEPIDMPGILELAREHGLKVVEDVAQAHGAKLNGQYLGTFGDVAAFSTMSGKHHCSGPQGGMVYTRHEASYWRARAASDRGKVNPGFPGAHGNVLASLNLNSNDLAAAIGRVQLRKLPEIVAARRRVVTAIAEGLRDLAVVTVPAQLPGAEASYWFLRLQLNPDAVSCGTDDLHAALKGEGLPFNPRYSAFNHDWDWFVNRRVLGDSGFPWTSPLYKGNAPVEFSTPNAWATVDCNINVSIHEKWGDHEVADTIAIFRKVDAAFRA